MKRLPSRPRNFAIIYTLKSIVAASMAPTVFVAFESIPEAVAVFFLAACLLAVASP